MKAGSYLNIVFWPRVQHCCKVALVMNGDKQPTRRNKTRTQREARQSDWEYSKDCKYCGSLSLNFAYRSGQEGSLLKAPAV